VPDSHRLPLTAGPNLAVSAIVGPVLARPPAAAEGTVTRVTARYERAAPYADDALALPVASVEAALPFYQGVMGFQLVEQKEAPHKAAILARDSVRIGLAENGGDPTQEGCFFEVDDVAAAFAELRANGLGRDDAEFRVDTYGETAYRVFFVVAPDGLCYCLGQREGS